MTGSFSSGSSNCDPRYSIAPDTTIPDPASGCGSDSKAAPTPHKRRMSIPKRVVTVPVAGANNGWRPKGGGDGAPPSDSWAWRKYGQKPIKGSPYPRGYYRCSSSKGCPARKQVERSRVDPTVFVVSYACDHNHPWPLSKNRHRSSSPSRPSPSPEEEPSARVHQPNDKFSDLMVEQPSTLMMHEDYYGFSDVGSPTTEDFLLGVGFAEVPMPYLVECDDVGREGEEDEEEDSLFAGLGELPECSPVFRRGFLERQILVKGEASQRRRLAATQ